MDPLLLARALFAANIAFHILFRSLSLSLVGGKATELHHG